MNERRLVSGCLLVVALAAPRRARAHDDYPPEIARDLQAPAAPACSVCHLGGKTAGETVVTPFGWSMRARGLGGDPQSVDTALAADMRDRVDSDGDGVIDTDELVAGTDPNEPGAAKDYADPALGCAVGGHGSSSRTATGGGVLVAAALLRRRRSTS